MKPHHKNGYFHPRNGVLLRELGLRDGLQLTKTFPATDKKIEWIDTAYQAGVRHLEVGSFLPASSFPQFADIRELIGHMGKLPGCVSSALTLNERAIDDSLATGVGEIVVSISATEEHSLANIRRTRKEAVGLVRHADRARTHMTGPPMLVAAISVAFGCTIAGEVSRSDVTSLAFECAEAGADAVAVADTVGYAGPRQVGEMCSHLVPLLQPLPLIVHLHDTRGTGIANAFAALDSGVRILDGTIGGLGGCPFAPGATGNVAFEDLVFLCERSGFSTGIELDRLFDIHGIIKSTMPDETLSGMLGRAGPPPNIGWMA